ncbi:hypothetical protein K503DRAFT_859163 [Rhizopogon vinicolor AM-OR11-026]|uniref:Uncharacterized protein n=1 Tax=Rhizopogon vinicolor AM-OR11-026 TaxID=1314800 RepID=A0A1B7MPM2_9AGAM|nr:hypothetical protein K503DRAFT_859163 [Rhizopogon vinicolor AM-OR11-026]
MITWTQVLVSLSPTSSPASTVNDFTVMADGTSVGGETIHFTMFPPKLFKGRSNGLRTLLACITPLHLVLTRSFQNDPPKRVGYTQTNECSKWFLDDATDEASQAIGATEDTDEGTAAQYFSYHLVGKSDLIKVYSHNLRPRLCIAERVRHYVNLMQAIDLKAPAMVNQPGALNLTSMIDLRWGLRASSGFIFLYYVHAPLTQEKNDLSDVSSIEARLKQDNNDLNTERRDEHDVRERKGA